VFRYHNNILKVFIRNALEKAEGRFFVIIGDFRDDKTS